MCRVRYGYLTAAIAAEERTHEQRVHAFVVHGRGGQIYGQPRGETIVGEGGQKRWVLGYNVHRRFPAIRPA